MILDAVATAAPATDLDDDQREAVAHGDGPCLVLAGPGSGKTRVVVERFLRLVRDGVGPEQQLVLTYTRKAADEMRGRAEAAHGSFPDDTPLTNYHAFAFRVVRDWGWLAGVSPAFRIADPAERWLHAEAVLSELRPRLLWNALRPHDIMDPLLQVIAYAKQELVTPAMYAEWAERRLASCDDAAERVLLERHGEVAAVYAALDERYRRLGVFDFDDCILCAERLLDGHAAVRAAIADRVRYVMVDEYQDTNFAQARLVETLTRDHDNLMVVADDDQSIYKFRGASRANLDRFTRRFPQHRSIVLTRNYRSTPQIVAASRQVMAAATPVTRIAKQLVSDRADGEPVETWMAADERDEVTAVARECRSLVDGGMRPADIAWLFRKHVHMQAAMHALRAEGVPYQVTGGRGFFTERETKDVLALLAAASDPDDSLALLRCLHMPAWPVSGRGRVTLAAAARESATSLAALVTGGMPLQLSDSDADAARACVEDVYALHEMSEREDVRDVFFAALERSRYLCILDEEHGAARMQMSANLNKFGELLESFADSCDDRRVSTALRYLHILRDSRQADELATIEPIEDGIVLSTAHSAKGLEWPVVIVAHCSAEEWAGRPRAQHDLQLPDELVPEPAPAGDVAVDEERRLFYVAATRARDRLIFTWSRRYPRAFRDQVRTPFLDQVEGAGSQAVQIPSLHTAMTRPARVPGVPLPSRPRISVSDLREFKRCPRRFEYRTVWRLPVRPTVHGWYGTLMHDVLHAAAVRRSAGEVVDGDAMAALWVQAWDGTAGPKGARADLRTVGEEQLRRYAASAAWTEARVIATEDPVAIDAGEAEVVGRLDRVDQTAGECVVVDYKTSRPRDAEAVSRDLQVRAYAVALAQREQVDQATVQLHYLQTAEVVTARFDSGSLRRVQQQLTLTTAELAHAWKRGDFPAHPSAWLCRHCEFRAVCDEGRDATS